MLMEIIYVAVGVLAGVVVALKAIVPYTHSARLAAVESALEEVQGVVQKLLPGSPTGTPAASPAPAPAPAPKS